MSHLNIGSVPAEREQKRPRSGGQTVLSPNVSHPADHGASLLLHGGRTGDPSNHLTCSSIYCQTEETEG